MASGAITDQQITASSEWDKTFGAENARLHLTAKNGKRGAWSSKSNDLNAWIQVDFGRNVKVTKFATQGWGGEWVTSYTLSYSVDKATHFEIYQENNNEKVKKNTFTMSFRNTLVTLLPISDERWREWRQTLRIPQCPNFVNHGTTRARQRAEYGNIWRHLCWSAFVAMAA